MRRAATVLVVAGVLLLTGLAAFEALRNDEAFELAPPRRGSAPGLPERLEEAGVAGLLYLSTRRGTECAIQAVRLPAVAVESDVPAPDCRFAVAPSGLVATGFDCQEPGALLRPGGAVVDRFEGCSPAWKPTGELTFVRDGSVMAVPRSCAGTVDACARPVLTREQIEDALEPLLEPRPWTVREVAWLDETTVAAIVRGTVRVGGVRTTPDFIAVFEDRRLTELPSFGRARLQGLTVDPAARRIFVSGDVVQGIFELDQRGAFRNTLTVPGIPEVASLAFSPDGSWAAAAGRSTVLVFQPGEPPGRIFQLPFEAESVAWQEP